MLGYLYYCCAVLVKYTQNSSNSDECSQYLDKSLKVFSLNRIDHDVISMISQEMQDLETNSINSIDSGLPVSHAVYNLVFCVDHMCKLYLVKIPNVEMPHFKYYQTLQKVESMSAIRSSSLSSNMSKRLDFRAPIEIEEMKLD